MSLYIYGILAPPMRRTEEQRAEFVELARRLHIVISLDSLDEEDEECLLAIAPEAKGGLKFALCNEGGGPRRFGSRRCCPLGKRQERHFEMLRCYGLRIFARSRFRSSTLR